MCRVQIVPQSGRGGRKTFLFQKIFIDKSILWNNIVLALIFCKRKNNKTKNSVHSPLIWYIYILRTTIYHLKIPEHIVPHELWTLYCKNDSAHAKTYNTNNSNFIDMCGCVCVLQPKICISTQLNQQHFFFLGWKTFLCTKWYITEFQFRFNEQRSIQNRFKLQQAKTYQFVTMSKLA